MSGTVDSLSIKINASAKGANQQLDKLVEKMVLLRSTINGINVGNLNSLSTSIQNFSKAASGLSQVKTADFTRMAKGIEKLSNIRKGELNRAAIAITNISKACSKIGNVSDGANKIAQLAQGISRLGYKSTTQAIQNIPLLTKELKNMMTELSKAPTVSDNLIAMTNAMANLGAQASGIRSVGSTMNNAGRSGNSFFGIMRKGVSNIRNFVSGIHSATKHNRSFAATLGLLYAKFWTLRRILGAFGSAVKASMDYIEEYNYFNTTMEKIASEWDKDFSKFGYKNADAYGKSFEDRLTKMMHKMTGFKMNRTGTVTDSGIKNLGLDVTQMTNYAAGVAQVTNSVGMTGEASVATSKALSMLAGDMSSFKNLDMQTVMNNFSSGLIGQSRALYKYGIDITNATLATYAHELGIKKDISAMEQNEKMQLRMIAILDQSKVSWGDLAKTINSPSNQLRLLHNNFKSLSRTIGDMFLPVVAKVLPYVNGLVIAIRRLFEWTASMLGIDLKDVIGNSGGGYSDIFDGLDDDADDASNAIDGVADSADKAAASQKKLNKQLQSFDQLNNMTTTKTTKKDTSSDKDSSPIDLTDQLNAALADYEKVWNEAYDNMTNDAEKFADKLTKLFKKAWTSGDGSDIGSAVAGWLNKGIDWVNNHTDKWSKGLKKITTIMGTALNGFIENFKWAGLGKAIGNSIKGVLEAETNFFETVNWVNLGKGLSKTLNAAIKTGVLQSYFKSMASKLRAAIETAFGAITTFDFKGLGKALGQGINDFFKTMNKKNKQTGLNGWQELGKSISDGIKGIATSFTTALDTVNWEAVGQSIANFIASIDWGGVIWKLSSMVKSMITALGTTLTAETKENPVAGIITIGILGFTLRKGWKKLLGVFLGSKIGKSKISVGFSRVFAVIKKWSISKISNAAKALGIKIKSGVGKITVTLKNAYVGIKNWIANGAKISDLIKAVKTALGIQKGLTLSNIAVKIATKLATLANPDMAADDLARSLDDWFTNKIWRPLCKKISWLDEDSPMGVFQVPVKLAIKIGTTIKDFFSDTWNDTTAMTSGIDVGNDMANGVLKGFANALVYPANFLYNLIVKPVKDALGIHSPSTVFKEIAGFCVDGFMNNFDLKKKIKEKLDNLGKATIDIALKIKGSLDDKAKEIKEWWKGSKEKAKTLIAKAKGEISKKFDEVKEKWNGFKEKTKSVIAKAKGQADKVFSKIVDGWSNFTDETKTLFAKAKGKIEDSFGKAKEAWASFTEGTKEIYVYAKGKIEDKFKEVQQKWSEVKGGTKEFWAKAKATISDKYYELFDKWKNLKTKDIMITAKAVIKDGVEKIGSIWKSVRTKTATLTGKAEEKTKDIFKSIKEKWNSLTSKTAVLTATFKDMFTTPLKKAWNALAGAINKGIGTINKIPGVSIPTMPKLAKGGIFKNGSWHNIAKYANGGLPNMGQMFVAREAGPELVGTIGGHTAVMNNNQIVASVSDGVFNALNPVLTYLCNSINALNSRMDNIGGGMSVERYTEGDLLKVVRRENTNYRRRTGKGAFD